MPDKPRVLILTLGSMERDGWINPPLAFSLITMARDARFDTTFGNVLGYRPHDYARNAGLASARSENVDWCIMLDNDIVPAVSPLDLIADAPADADVVGVRYAIGGYNVRGVPSASDEMCPKGVQFTGNANFQEVSEVGGGVLCIRNTVWQNIPRGPWFQIELKTGSELLEWGLGEDVAFCRYVRSKGMKVYLHRTPAGHLHTKDLTKIVMQ